MQIFLNFNFAGDTPNAILKIMENYLSNLEHYLQGSAVLAFIAVYIGGVLVSFTPCVYPVAPIIVAYIGARGKGGRFHSFWLSLVYVLGTSLTFTVLGAVSALTGRLFGQIQSSPWTYFIVANVCIILGLSMLGVFTIRLSPAGFGGAGAKGTKGFLGAFLVGASSGLIMSPCTTPVLAALLTYVAASQNVVFGMILLFVFSIGMGTLLIALGTFSGLLGSIPRTGYWMVTVKKLFGWALIGIGEYFLLKAGTFWV